MLKVINIILISILGLFSVSSYAQSLQLGPKQSKSLTNNALWTVNATCNIQGNAKVKILVRVLKNKGTVNGRVLASGQTTAVTVQNHSQLSVSAEPGTKVNLVNLGSNSIQANCVA